MFHFRIPHEVVRLSKRGLLVDAERLIGSLVQGAFTGRRKRGDRAMRFLTGGRGSLLTAGNLLTVAGLAWGVLESLGPKTAVPRTGFGPGTAGSGPPLPPLPTTTQPASSGQTIPEDVLRVVRLTISAARADAGLSEGEKQVILSHARAAGAEDIVEAELSRTLPLADIVAGVSDPAMKRDLYTLAFAVVHADQGVSGAERVYLAQLGLALGLDAETAQQLERDALEQMNRAVES
jgi:uncharacterized membrane protein YebE (DUF533 family)